MSSARPPIGLHRYAILTTAATFLLLIAGSLVTSTDSGLAVPDWPLSYGTWFPPMVGGILYEHGHRMIAGVVGLLILILSVWLWRMESRRWVRVLGLCALGAMMLQALLGGLTVLLLLPPAVSIAHACLGQTVFCLVVALARGTSPAWVEDPTPVDDRGWLPARALGMILSGLTATQLMLGAVIRHMGYAVAPHALNAVVLLCLSVWVARKTAALRLPAVWPHAWRALALLVIQGTLGVAVLGHRGVVMLRTAHVAVGALVLVQSVVLAWELLRWTQPVQPSLPQPAVTAEVPP